MNAVSEAPSVEWSKTYGSYEGLVVIQTADGGYAVAGVNATPSDRGYGDYLPTLIKTSSTGELEWKITYGSDFGVSSAARSLVQTEDLGYALSGDGNWLLKTDSEGNVQWSRNFEFLNNYAVIQASDGGYVLAGFMYRNNRQDAVLLKTDENGNQLWNKTFNSLWVVARAIVETNDEGYALAGEWDGSFWFAKTDLNGDIVLNKTHHLSDAAVARSIAKTADGGYTLAGNNGDSACLVKIDSEGVMQWNSNYDYPPSVSSFFLSVAQTADGGYVAAGSPGALVRTDAFGNVDWKIMGIDLGSATNYVIITADGGYAVAGGANYAAGLAKFAPESPFSGYAVLIAAGVATVTVVAVALLYFKKRKR